MAARLHIRDFSWAHLNKGRRVKSGLLYVLIPMARALHCHAGALSPSVWGDGWSNLCTLITQWATGVQPHPAPESNQTGQPRLLGLAIIHTHSHTLPATLVVLHLSGAEAPPPHLPLYSLITTAPSPSFATHLSQKVLQNSRR